MNTPKDLLCMHKEILTVINRDPLQFVVNIQKMFHRIDLTLGEFFLALQRVSSKNPDPVDVAAFIMLIRSLATKELGLSATTPVIQAVPLGRSGPPIIHVDFWGTESTGDSLLRFDTQTEAIAHWVENNPIPTEPHTIFVYGWELQDNIPYCVFSQAVMLGEGEHPEYLTEGDENAE